MFLQACANKGTPEIATGTEEMRIIEPARVSPEIAYQKAESGQAVLVCAYDDDERCKRLKLDHAMTLYEFESNLMYLPVDKEIIFYCA
jgi:hypothetical protein